jgi:threonine 3-dehydrogenase
VSELTDGNRQAWYAENEKALVKKHAKPGLWMDEVPVPEIGINDVLIKIHKTSICGTDVHIYNWDAWAQKTIKPPMVIGHEYVGTVAAVGSNVDHLEIGELVSGEGHIVCGHCRNCMAGRRHLCNHTVGGGSIVMELLLNIWRFRSVMSGSAILRFQPM